MMNLDVKGKILITGGAGFLASHVKQLLDATNHDVVALLNPGSSKHGYKTAYFSIEELLKCEESFDAIFHLASYIPYGKMDKPDVKLIDNNISLTVKLVRAYPDARMVYSSSVAVYGKPLSGKINVSSPFMNPDLYGLSKLAGEAIVKNIRSYSIIRFSSIIGPSMKVNSFVPAIIKQALQTKVIRILGTGERRQNYIDVRDAAALCMTNANASPSNVMLGVGETSYSNKEVAEIVAMFTDAKINFTSTDSSPSYVYDQESAYEVLKFQPRFTLRETINDMIA